MKMANHRKAINILLENAGSWVDTEYLLKFYKTRKSLSNAISLQRKDHCIIHKLDKNRYAIAYMYKFSYILRQPTNHYSFWKKLKIKIKKFFKF